MKGRSILEHLSLLYSSYETFESFSPWFTTRLTSKFTVHMEFLINNLKHGLDLGGESNTNGHFDRAEDLELMTDIFAK